MYETHQPGFQARIDRQIEEHCADLIAAEMRRIEAVDQIEFQWVAPVESAAAVHSIDQAVSK